MRVVEKQVYVSDGSLWVPTLTGCFPPVVGSSSDVVIPGVPPLNQRLHQREEIQAWRRDSRTEEHWRFSGGFEGTGEDLALVHGSLKSLVWFLIGGPSWNEGGL